MTCILGGQVERGAALMKEAYPRLVKDARCVMTGEMEKLVVADTFRSAYFKFKTYDFFNKIT